MNNMKDLLKTGRVLGCLEMKKIMAGVEALSLT